MVPVEIRAGQTSSLHVILGVNRLGVESAVIILNLISLTIIGFVSWFLVVLLYSYFNSTNKSELLKASAVISARSYHSDQFPRSTEYLNFLLK